jgi:hypothetical protein
MLSGTPRSYGVAFLYRRKCYVATSIVSNGASYDFASSRLHDSIVRIYGCNDRESASVCMSSEDMRLLRVKIKGDIFSIAPCY